MRVLVIGGGISGLTAAIEASEAGCEVVLVERNPYLGGRVAQMHQYFPKLCPPACGLEINLRRIRSSTRIECLTLAELVEITGEAGHYHATIQQAPRFVTERCTACGECVAACPVARPDAFNLGMGSTRAVYLPFPLAWPARYAIDPSVCEGAACARCVDACPYGAIDLAMPPRSIEMDVGAVIWATGWDPFDASDLEGLGFGTCKNVISNLMMERLASSDGPTQGRIQRPSDGKGIESIAFVQCAGSRDENHLEHCSGVCCMASLKQARYVRAQYPDAHIHVFYIDIRAPGRQELFFAETRKDERFHLIKGKVAKVTEDPASGDLVVETEDVLGEGRIAQKVSMVVLATGMVPVRGREQVPGGLARDRHGFLQSPQPRAGLFAAGCARRPVDVASSVRDATSAALKALQSCVAAKHG